MQGYSSEEQEITKPSIAVIEDYNDEVGMGEPLGQLDPEEHQQLPFKYIGALEMFAKSLPGKTIRGSGILISSNLVLTAAHNVWANKVSQEVSNIKFYPGVCGFLDESKCYECSILYYPQEHKTSKDPKYDYALLQLNEPIEGLQKDEFLPLSSSLEHEDLNSVNKKLLAIYGYPNFSFNKKSLSETFKTKQWGLTSSKKVLEINPKKFRLIHQISSAEGQSGCPIIEVGPNKTFSIVGIHKGSYKFKSDEEEEEKKTVNVGRIITADLIETLERQIEKRRPRMFKILEKPIQLQLKTPTKEEEKNQQIEAKIGTITPPKLSNQQIEAKIETITPPKLSNIPKFEPSHQKDVQLVEVSKDTLKLKSSSATQKLQQLFLKVPTDEGEKKGKKQTKSEKFMTHNKSANFLKPLSPNQNESELMEVSKDSEWFFTKIIPVDKMDDFKFIYQSLQKPKSLMLLFRGSEFGFRADKFHQRCDGKPNTFTIIRTEFGKNIAGFTPVEWEAPLVAKWKSDNPKKSFLLSLDLKVKMPLKDEKKNKAIYCSIHSGPAFGDLDISLSDRCNLNKNSFSNFPWCYSGNNKFKANDQDSCTKFCGNPSGMNFRVTEYQVFQVFY